MSDQVPPWARTDTRATGLVPGEQDGVSENGEDPTNDEKKILQEAP